MDPTTGHQFPKTNIKNISRSVLVTGGAGYVGSHCCKFLAKNGYVPVVIDRNLKNKPVAFGPSFEIDLPTNIQALDDIIKRYNIDSCIHFAGSASVAESVANPSAYYKNNVIATLSLLDKLLEHDIKTFVYSSSAATYGDPGSDDPSFDPVAKGSLIPKRKASGKIKKKYMKRGGLASR